MTDEPLTNWPHLGVTPDIDRAPWTDIDRDNIVEVKITRVGLMRNGTVSGRATVMVEFKIPGDKRSYIGETTLRIANMAARAIAASPAFAEEDLSG